MKMLGTATTTNFEDDDDDEQKTLEQRRSLERTTRYYNTKYSRSASPSNPKKKNHDPHPQPEVGGPLPLHLPPTPPQQQQHHQPLPNSHKANLLLIKKLIQKENRLSKLKRDVATILSSSHHRHDDDDDNQDETLVQKKGLQLHLLRLEAAYAPYNKEEKGVVKVLYDEYSGLKRRLLSQEGSGSRSSAPLLPTVFEGVMSSDTNDHHHRRHSKDKDSSSSHHHQQQNANVLEEDKKQGGTSSSTSLGQELQTLEQVYLPLRQKYHFLTKNKNKKHSSKGRGGGGHRRLSKEEKRLLFPEYDQYRELKKRVRLLRILTGK